jgi:hypothetical protein
LIIHYMGENQMNEMKELVQKLNHTVVAFFYNSRGAFISHAKDSGKPTGIHPEVELKKIPIGFNNKKKKLISRKLLTTTYRSSLPELIEEKQAIDFRVDSETATFVTGKTKEFSGVLTLKNCDNSTIRSLFRTYNECTKSLLVGKGSIQDLIGRGCRLTEAFAEHFIDEGVPYPLPYLQAKGLDLELFPQDPAYKADGELFNLYTELKGHLSLLFRHSPDYRSVSYKGKTYALTTNQSKIVKALDEARLNRTPYLEENYLFEGVLERELHSGKLQDSFRNTKGKGFNEVWNDLIASGPRAGTFFLKVT